jgi:hypothetical protein
VLCCLDIAAFATITVGSVPESFALTAACCTAMYWLVMNDTIRRWQYPVAWVLLGFAAVGITVTNVIPLVVLMVGALLRRRVAVARAVLVTGAVAGSVVILNAGIALAGSGPDIVVGAGLTQTADKLRPVATPVAQEIAWSVAHTFMAPTPIEERTWTNPAQNPEYETIFSFTPPYRHGWPSWWRALSTAVLLLLGTVGLVRYRPVRMMALAPLLIVLANGGLHLFFGDHFVLYLLHWETSLLVLIAGVCFLPGRVRKVGELALAGFVVACAVNSASLLGDLFSRLASI